MSAAEACASLAADRIDFIDENDRRLIFLGLIKQVSHAGSADADVHFDKVGTGNGEEGYASFTGDRLGQVRFTGPWRADQQNAFRHARADIGIFFGFPQEIDDFGKLFFFFVGACDVCKGHALFVVGLNARPRFAERHRFSAAAGLAHHKVPEDDDNAEEHEIGHKADPPRRFLRGADIVIRDGFQPLLFARRLNVFHVFHKHGEVRNLILEMVLSFSWIRKSLPSTS